MADKNPAFAGKASDPKDVSWALTTADTCWKKGDRAEALKWLRRAVETASEAELDERALELAKAAADLTTHMASMVPPAAPSTAQASVSIPLPPKAPVAPLSARAPATAARIAPKPGPRAPLSAAASSSAPMKELTRESPRKADRRSATNEASRAGSSRKKSLSRTDRLEAAPDRGTRADEIDAWPTEVVPGDELPPALVAKTSDRRASQAVRVYVWRDADGSVRVGHVGASAPKKAIEATLVATDPFVSLLDLLAEKT